MIDPSPGATGVPDNLGEIAFEGFGPSRITLTGHIAALLTPLLASTTYTASFTTTGNGSNCASQSGKVDVGSFTTK